MTSRNSCSSRRNKATHWASYHTIGKPTILQKLLIIVDTHLDCSPSSSTLVNTLSFTALRTYWDSGTHSRGPLSRSLLPETLDSTLICSHGKSRSFDPPFCNPSTSSTPKNIIPVWEAPPSFTLGWDFVKTFSTSFSDQGSPSLSKLDKREKWFELVFLLRTLSRIRTWAHKFQVPKVSRLHCWKS